MPDEELTRIRNEVDEEVTKRLDLLATRVDHYLDVANEHRTTDEPLTEADPDHFDKAWDLLFKNADSETPTADAIDGALGTEGLAGGGAAAAPGPAARAEWAPGSAGATAGRYPPGRGSGRNRRRCWRRRRSGQERHRSPVPGGQVPVRAAAHGGDLSEHHGFRAVGLGDRGGLLHVGFEAAVFGLNDEITRDMHRDIEQSLHPHAAGAAGAAGAGTAPGGAHDAAHAGGAAGGARDPSKGDAVGARPHGQGKRSPTGREMVDNDHIDVADLAGRIYPMIRSRLRMELLVDRERAGLLTDFR